MTERGQIFKWTTRCDNAFAKLKLCLQSSPNLAHPDFTLPFILGTDTYQCGIGAVLFQCQEDGSERVIAFASRVMSKAEWIYSVTRQELLAAVTYIHHLRPFLLGQCFLLSTDHGSLQWLHTLKEPEGQLARWIECLKEYDFEIQHHKEHHHQNADALSRHPTHFSDHQVTEDNVLPTYFTSKTEQPKYSATIYSVTAEQPNQLTETYIRFTTTAKG